MALNGNVTYWTYWDFAGKNPSTGENFGMVDKDTITPYYPYYVMKWFGNNSAVGDPILNLTVSTSSNVRTLSWLNSGKLNIMFIHKSSITESITLQGVSGQFNYQKIDDPSETSYLNPTVQTGTVNAGDTLTLNGYTVMLLQQTF